MIARAFVKQDPFVIWGTGERIRNWTYCRRCQAAHLLSQDTCMLRRFYLTVQAPLGESSFGKLTAVYSMSEK
jgi:hypothetical protein